jgi:FkbM family methyltransferase
MHHLPAIKSVITALGLKPLALRAYNHYIAEAGRLKARFRIVVAGAEVVFVTEDPNSKRFFHSRYRSGQLHEPPVTLELVAQIRTARVFADVGAHIGYFGCVAGAVNRRLQVFLFEMNHNLIGIIERNLAANRLDNCRIVNQAVADRSKPIAYPRDSTDPGLSIQTPSGQPDGGTEVVVEAVSLDDFFLAQGVVPDVIKIDVQGAELQALQGAERLLRKHHPVLFLELHPQIIGRFGGTVGELHELLMRHGYRLRRIADHRGGEHRRLIAVEGQDDLPEDTHMLLCV